jgi:hypothetical protein
LCHDYNTFFSADVVLAGYSDFQYLPFKSITGYQPWEEDKTHFDRREEG